MSAYQYYEFQAIDRPLSREEIQTLRGCSTRARITTTSFTNEYSFGSFKGDADMWMAKYFDAFVHVANWGTRLLMFRLPVRLLNVETAGLYARGRGKFSDPLTVSIDGANVIFRFCSHEDGRWGDAIQGDGLLGDLVGIRTELASGDFRALYLAWLRGIQLGDQEAGMEPPVPAGLNSLSPALVSLIGFLEIDRDLVSAAAAASPDLVVPTQDAAEMERWVADLPAPEKNDLLMRLLEGNESQIGIELRNRFEQGRSKGNPKPAVRPRTAGDLLSAAKRIRTSREQEDARRAAEEEARRVREAAAARETHLELLATRVPQAWAKINELIATRQTKAYSEAVQMLLDLREITARQRAAPDFDRRLAEIRVAHAKKRVLIEQLDAGGLE
ncbi:MAG: hypothetical protein KF833_17125 [Verrucomicrobiae bacterium]|nr:hypothetical protein [Verrucomicrobiae bacterium]